MNYLTFENLSKSYGEQILFDEISLNINKGQKVALIARNGSGKTSLLRILAGDESPEGEKARIIIHPNVRIGYLKQEPEFDDRKTVLDTALDSPGAKMQAIRVYEEALHSGENKRIQKAIEEIERLKAWDIEARVREILDKLEVGRFDQKVGSLSGGQRKRLSLARLLINEPDFLILDEPTNHLDLEMIEWLEEFLKQPNLTLLLVTHDRYFMERICDTIVELDRGKLYKYQGSYSDYLEKKTAREQNESIQLDKNKKLLKTELEWVRRQPKARGTKAKSRIQKFEELRAEVGGVKQEQELELEIAPARLGSKIIELQYISKSYGEKVLFKDLHYKFKKRDRLGIVGPNGSGKSTLIDVLTGRIRPDDGKVVHGETLKIGYYTQEGIQLKSDKRVIDVVRDIAEYIPMTRGQKITAAALLERFMFPRPQQQVYVSQLSGGEKRRLYLVTVLMQNPNFLILDEPTNDLDIFTLNALEDYLVDFPGCLVIVSHDRFFMDKLVDHLFVFEGDGYIRDFPGNYTQYRTFAEEKLNEERRAKELEREKKIEGNFEVTDRQKQKTLKNTLRKLERELEQLNKRKSAIESVFLEKVPSAEEIKTLSSELDSIKETIEEKEMLWMEAAEEIENKDLI